MTLKEKIEKYLREHKAPVTAAQLAHHFLVRTTSAARTLRALEIEGKAKCAPWARARAGQRTLEWTIVRARPVAVSRDFDNRMRAAGIQNSFPHVRGYDD